MRLTQLEQYPSLLQGRSLALRALPKRLDQRLPLVEIEHHSAHAVASELEQRVHASVPIDQDVPMGRRRDDEHRTELPLLEQRSTQPGLSRKILDSQRFVTQVDLVKLNLHPTTVTRR